MISPVYQITLILRKKPIIQYPNDKNVQKGLQTKAATVQIEFLYPLPPIHKIGFACAFSIKVITSDLSLYCNPARAFSTLYQVL